MAQDSKIEWTHHTANLWHGCTKVHAGCDNCYATSFLQVFLVSINTIFLSRTYYPGVAIAGFAISYLWVGNVKKVTIATKAERIIYSTGAMLGGLTGMMMIQILNYINNI